MSPNDYLLDPKTLREYFRYCNGHLVRLKRTGVATYIGQKVFGTKHSSGYRYLRFQGKMLAMHRVVFSLCHNRIPKSDVDHRDRNRANNRITNLREASESENNFNSKTHKRNTSGHRGVFWEPEDSKWSARIQLDGKRYRLGRYRTKNAAIRAYSETALLIRKGFYR